MTLIILVHVIAINWGNKDKSKITKKSLTYTGIRLVNLMRITTKYWLEIMTKSLQVSIMETQSLNRNIRSQFKNRFFP